MDCDSNLLTGHLSWFCLSPSFNMQSGKPTQIWHHHHHHPKQAFSWFQINPEQIQSSLLSTQHKTAVHLTLIAFLVTSHPGLHMQFWVAVHKSCQTLVTPCSFTSSCVCQGYIPPPGALFPPSVPAKSFASFTDGSDSLLPCPVAPWANLYTGIISRYYINTICSLFHTPEQALRTSKVNVIYYWIGN